MTDRRFLLGIFLSLLAVTISAILFFYTRESYPYRPARYGEAYNTVDGEVTKIFYKKANMSGAGDLVIHYQYAVNGTTYKYGISIRVQSFAEPYYVEPMLKKFAVGSPIKVHYWVKNPSESYVLSYGDANARHLD